MSINYSVAGTKNDSDYKSRDFKNEKLSSKFKYDVERDIDNIIFIYILEIIRDICEIEDKDIQQEESINWKFTPENLSPVKIYYNKKAVEAQLTEVGIKYFFDDIFPFITAYVEFKSEENFFTFSKSFFGNKNLNYEGIETYCNGKSTVCDINNINIKLDYSENDICVLISTFLKEFLNDNEKITPENFLFYEP